MNTSFLRSFNIGLASIIAWFAFCYGISSVFFLNKALEGIFIWSGGVLAVVFLFSQKDKAIRLKKSVLLTADVLMKSFLLIIFSFQIYLNYLTSSLEGVNRNLAGWDGITVYTGVFIILMTLVIDLFVSANHS